MKTNWTISFFLFLILVVLMSSCDEQILSNELKACELTRKDSYSSSCQEIINKTLIKVNKEIY